MSSDCLHNELMQKGQALVVVLLVLGVVATIGLSVVSRSITEIGQSTAHEESARALEAAEAGLEKYLGGVGPDEGVIVNLGTAQFSLNSEENIGLGESSYQVPTPLDAGDIVTIVLKNYNPQDIDLCWGKAHSTAKIMVIMYYQTDTGEYRSLSRQYNPGASPLDPMWYPPGGAGPCGPYDLEHSIGINFANDESGHIPLGNHTQPLYMRIRMLSGSGEPVAVSSDDPFPDMQAGSIEAIGVAGDSVQRLKATVPEDDMPGIFDNAIFSGGSLVK